ncbi:bacterio-opsin activator domain-containing protein [Halocalculus aciditolerans]|uniref:XRE family transcriptional regulator n=1 Tax=Halocalculus aciditolerans TaxID=1383812 RepID=A0A830FA88_9EURY|nr:bacterio-opsin activator domain-containing protein [Halocalculus aciditolerans]GGL69701.1 XRE family transcriptional regulator [Halocalculus aciditolerans]
MARHPDGDALTDAEYERLRDATESYREDLVVALCGEAGLRPVELATLRPADLTRRGDDATHDCFRVRSDGEERTAYVPPDVADDVRKYVNATGIASTDRIFDVTPRRLQMLVSTVAERAAAGDDRLADVSTRDLRAYFARRLLVDDGVDPRIVQATGGWSHLGSLEPYIDPPTDRAVAAALHDAWSDNADGADGEPDSNGVDEATPQKTGAPAGPAGSSVDATSTALGVALDDVSTRADAEQRACETLSDAYDAAAVCDANGSVRACVGLEDADERAAVADALDAIIESHGGLDSVRFVERALDTGVAERERTLAATAVRSGDQTHGLLCVAVDASRPTHGLHRLLTDAGRRVGWVIAATERKELLFSETGVELVFEADAESFFAAASAALDCELHLDGLVPAPDHALLCFVAATGTSAEAFLERAADSDAVSDARLIRDIGDRVRLELVLREPSPTVTLVELGGAVESLTAADGAARLSVVFPSGHDVRAIVERVTSTFPGVSFQAKREASRSPLTGDLYRTLDETLTEKQCSALQAAYFADYFEWPRGSTAEELADSMGVSAPTLHNHLRKAQQKLFTVLFDAA